jgi:hypothetical protein
MLPSDMSTLHPARQSREDPMQDQDRLRQRAYEIWEREGRPEGRHEEHWVQAHREIEAEEGGGASAGPAAPDDAPTPTSPGGAEATPAQASAAADAVGAPRKAETGSLGPQAGSGATGPGPRH